MQVDSFTQDLLAALGKSKVIGKITENPFYAQTTKDLQMHNIQQEDTLKMIPHPYQIMKGFQMAIGRSPPPTPAPVPAQPFLAQQPTTVQSETQPSKGNTFLYHILDHKDPVMAVLPEYKIENTITHFKEELATNLHMKNYFSKFGFSRKKNTSLSDMQEELRHTDTDAKMSEHALKYIAIICCINIIILDKENFTRKCVEGIDAKDMIVLRVHSDGSYSNLDVYTEKDLFTLCKTWIWTPNSPRQEWETKSLGELKHIYKFLTGDEKCTMRKKEQFVQDLKEKIEN